MGVVTVDAMRCFAFIVAVRVFVHFNSVSLITAECGWIPMDVGREHLRERVLHL